MESAEDKHWAQRALIDPLNEPEPSAEDGPGTHFFPPSETASTVSRNPSVQSPSRTSSKLQKNNPFRKSSSASKNPFINKSEISRRVSDTGSRNTYPSPPPSASPRQDKFAHRNETFGEYDRSRLSPTTGDAPGRPRGSSLGERFPGDKSHRPLETLTKESKKAYRAPHLRKHHHIRPDTIDSLDVVGHPYHHEGPFDATYYARNTSFRNSPLEAVAASNEEALKATPREKIIDAVERHRPLDGVASYAPGEVDRNGHMYRYEQGENMMIDGNPEGGAYKRWPGVQYHPDDIKGKGEPSYTIEKKLKESRLSPHTADGGSSIEMTSRRRAKSSSGEGDRYDGPGRENVLKQMWEGNPEGRDGNVARANTTGKRHSGGGSIRRRFGSIRKSLGGEE